MSKKMIPLFLLLSFATVAQAVYTGPEPEGFVSIVGPRIGVTYVNQDSAAYSRDVGKIFEPGDYYPVNTMFGISFEQRLVLGSTRSHFAFQEILMITGLEQAVAFPSASALIGFRGHSGFEFGIGPILSLSGIGVITAVGWTISYKGVFVPVDISVVLPNRKRETAIALTTGFNFRIK